MPVLQLCLSLQQQDAFQLSMLDFSALPRPTGQALPLAGHHQGTALPAIQEQPNEPAAEEPPVQPCEPAVQTQPAQEEQSAPMALGGGESTTSTQVMLLGRSLLIAAHFPRKKWLELHVSTLCKSSRSSRSFSLYNAKMSCTACLAVHRLIQNLMLLVFATAEGLHAG